MLRADAAHRRFVRALLPDHVAEPGIDGRYRAGMGRRLVALDASAVLELVDLGVLARCERGCRPTAVASAWIRCQLVEGDVPVIGTGESAPPEPARQPPTESSRSRLATANGAAFLLPHQIEAGERFRRLFERAQLRSRVTMSYNAARTTSGGAGTAHDLTDMAADARRSLARAIGTLPPDCAGVVLDVCGFEKGLQLVESERQWPRRSAKLVLRIGLEQLARHFGFAPVAVGKAGRGAPQAWMEEGARPPMFSAP